ncbi:MAG: tRNA pseudouridine(55) synthase TruB [Nitrospiraceae bacterium]|nr:MAG: tRNA pseudouridine(55) synthase TruB [Nitrospiraceae bacterium]
MDFVINLNKPKGITSQEATTNVKKILRAKKAGHTGTLDPAATGVLLICTNRATRFASYFSELNKQYSAVMKLGETTDTQDAEGTVIEKKDTIEVDEITLKKTLQFFLGKVLQTPPMFSALKFRGKPLYKYAHKGLDIPRKPREVIIHSLELQDMNFPFVRFTVICSKGTYIRTLCHDIGRQLGTGAHLFELERTSIDVFSIQESLSIEELRTLREGLSETGQSPQNFKGVYTLDSALSWMPELKVPYSRIKAVKNGNPIRELDGNGFPEVLKTAPGIKIKSPEGELLAVGSFISCNNEIKMDVVLAP